MNTRILYILSLLFILFSFNAFASGTAKRETRKVASFDQINVGSAFVVYLSQGTEQSVVVEIEEKYIDKVQTTVRNGMLYIELKNLNEGNNRDLRTMNVYITIPSVKNVEASGASKVIMQTAIDSKETVSFKISGASSVNEFSLSCKRFEVELTGASKMNINLTAGEVDVNVVGASNLKMDGKVGTLNLNGAGASKIDIRNLVCEKENIEAVGATKLSR